MRGGGGESRRGKQILPISQSKEADCWTQSEFKIDRILPQIVLSEVNEVFAWLCRNEVKNHRNEVNEMKRNPENARHEGKEEKESNMEREREREIERERESER